ncbi:unnamed protein product [Lepeophtheirus salmonis]|uniref:Transporter n=1 Tax=Lepeophtheirus salmonis TaxID=72036 RepID=A0A7R8CMV3_LEPSM|nr:unnamed protein product [Lepeophtheirus salmonis]CAF2868560.1 unnamed protein product [Lepeophtheirus salmonis]
MWTCNHKPPEFDLNMQFLFIIQHPHEQITSSKYLYNDKTTSILYEHIDIYETLMCLLSKVTVDRDAHKPNTWAGTVLRKSSAIELIKYLSASSLPHFGLERKVKWLLIRCAMKKVVPEREEWGNHCEFVLTSLGLAVGLGNIWRFPFVCFENGGGPFLIPYFVMLVLIGLPTFFLEQSIGQYGRVGANKLFGRMAPIFKGLGYAILAVRAYVNVYYLIICAWSFYYLFVGFTSELPWGKCDGEWNTYDCYSSSLAKDCPEAYYNGTCYSYKEYCSQHGLAQSAEDYFNGNVLGLTKNKEGDRYDFDDYGTIQWKNCLKAYGKMAYVITLSPYVVLTGLISYSATLDGALDGIIFFFTNSEWEKLWEIDIWAAAAAQIFFSLSLGLGSQLVLASYNNFHNNTRRDAFIISICNSLTSLYAGIVVFSILGFIAKQTEADKISDVVNGGISLAFVTYPTAVLEMDLPPLWSFLFFFMLINLAMSSISGGVQAILACIIDEKPSLENHRAKLVVVICILFFALGIPMTTNGGILVFTVFDSKCTSSLLFLAFLEVILVSWVYGTDRFFDNLDEMKIHIPKLSKYIWKALWTVITPVILIVIVILRWSNIKKVSFEDYEFPSYIQAFGWILELSPLMVLFIFPIPILIQYWIKGNRGWELFSKVCSPSSGWYTVDRPH